MASPILRFRKKSNESGPLSITIGGDFKFKPDSVAKRYFKDRSDQGKINEGFNFKVEAYGKEFDVFVSPSHCPLTIYDQNDSENPDGKKYIFYL